MMATTTEKILELVRNMSEQQVAEVLDFAEFLQAKNTPGEASEDSQDLAEALDTKARLDRGEETVIPWEAVKTSHGL